MSFNFLLDSMNIFYSILRLQYDYKISPFPYLPPNTPIYSSLVSLSSWPLSSLSIFAWRHMYVCVCIHIFLIIICSVCTMLVVCTCSGVTISAWITTWFALPKEDYFKTFSKRGNHAQYWKLNHLLRASEVTDLVGEPTPFQTTLEILVIIPTVKCSLHLSSSKPFFATDREYWDFKILILPVFENKILYHFVCILLDFFVHSLQV